MAGILIGVGAGPGDPNLLTLKGLQTLEDADIIVIADSGSKSALDSIISQFSFEDKLVRVEVPMTKDEEVLRQAWDEGFALIKSYLENEQVVAQLVLGDASLYASFTPSLLLAKEAGYEVRIVPGIMTASAAAATTLTPLAIKDEVLHFVPALSTDLIDSALSSDANIVFYKAKRNFEYIVSALKKLGRIDEAYLVEKLGMPGERVSMDLTNAEPPSSYFTTIFVSAKHSGS